MGAILAAAAGGYFAGIVTMLGLFVLVCIIIWKDVRG